MNNTVELENSIRVRSEQVRYIYDSFLSALLGTFLAAIMLFFLQWSYVDQDALLLWLLVFFVFNFSRVFMVVRFNQLQPDDYACKAWGTYFSISSFIMSLVWCVGIYISFPEDDLSHQLTVAMVVVGLSAGAVSTISVQISTFFLFVSPILLTIIVLFFFADQMVIVGALVMMSLFIFSGAMKIGRSNTLNITLRIEADERQDSLLKAGEVAREASQAKSDFLANMSHELRTPLHGIMGFTQLALQSVEANSDSKLKKYLSQISNSSERLKVLLDDLLDISKLEAGQMELKYQYYDLADIFADCIAEQKVAIDNKHLVLEYDWPDASLPEVWCDGVRIGQVIFNLLSNAIKFSPDAGTLRIFATESRITSIDNSTIAAVRFGIADSGRGIPESELELVFDKFVQSSKNKVSDGGTGLGLAISREIVLAHHGRIWADSNNGQGAVFTVMLPLAWPGLMSEFSSHEAGAN